MTMRILGATYVEYPGGSLLGKLLAVATLLPAFAYCSLVTLVIARRSVRAVSVLIGLVLSHLLNAAIKMTLNMPRPEPFPDALHPLTSPGMPSNHAQQAAFVAAYVATMLLITQPLRDVSSLPHRDIVIAERVIALIACLVYCSSVAISRVYLRCHTVEQVIAGSAIGLLTGCCWTFAETAVLSTSTFKHLLCSKLGKALRIECPDVSGTVNTTRTAGRTQLRFR